MAEEAKKLGNAALQAKKFDEAIAHYTHAISLDGTQHTYYSNRAAAFQSKGDYTSALKDAQKCIELAPQWPKGYARKGAALHAMKRYEEARSAYVNGLEENPHDASLKSGLADVTRAEQAHVRSNNPLQKLFGDDLIPKLAQHPKFRQYLSDNAFMTKIRFLQANPQTAMQTMFQDPQMQEVLSYLLGINIDTSASASDEPAAASSSTSTQQPVVPEEAAKEEPAEEEMEVERSPEEEAEFQKKAKAKAYKDAGNELYKAKKFEEALAQYELAISTDPGDVTFRNNKCAVFLEQKQYDMVLEEGQRAIEIGREHRADFELLAKIYVRMAKAAQKQGDRHKAIELMRNAQVEHFTKDTERQIKLMELELKKEKAAAYIDPDKAAEAKERGNEKYRAGDFPAAVKEYEEAVKRDPKNPAYYNNLAAALSKIGDFQGAKRNCEKALDIDPKYVKALAKKGDIEFLSKEYHKALESYKAGLAIDATNAACKQGLAKTTAAVNAGGNDQERAQHAMADPEIQAILQDPIIRNILAQMQTDPNSANKALQDPTIRTKIEKLVASGILQIK